MHNLREWSTGPLTRPFRLALVLATAMGSVVLVAASERVRGGPGVALVLMTTAAALWIGRSEWRNPTVPGWVVAAVIATLVVVAMATPPHRSNDLWSYEMYGRIVSVHHANPWVRPPSHFASDPFLARVSTGWRSTRSVYGPVFVTFAALVAMVARSSALVARLGFQGAEAVAVLGTLLLLRRLTHSNGAVLWFGLQPVVWTSAVNGGHNDALVGLALLGGAALAWRRRAAAAGIVVGCAALVKFTALLGLAGVVVWMLVNRRRKDATRVAVSCLAVIGAGVAFAPRSIGVLLSSNHNVSRASVWNIFNTYLVPGHVRAHGGWQIDVVISAAVIAVIGLVAFLATRLRKWPDPFLPVAATTGAYTAASSYVLPWYSLWSLPSFAVDCRNPLATIAAAMSGVVLASYELPQSHPQSAWDPLWRDLTTVAAPVVLFAAFLGTVLLLARGRTIATGTEVSAPA